MCDETTTSLFNVMEGWNRKSYATADDSSVAVAVAVAVAVSNIASW